MLGWLHNSDIKNNLQTAATCCVCSVSVDVAVFVVAALDAVVSVLPAPAAPALLAAFRAAAGLPLPLVMLF